MYRLLAAKLTNFFIRKDSINEKKKAIYLYGFEMLISSIVYALIFIVISILTKAIIESISFWLGLFIIRKTAGGHHAKSYKSCHLLFAANHIVFIILLKTLPSIYYYFSIIAIFVLSSLSLFIFAPVDHKNKPFIKNEYKRFKLISRIYSLILILLFLLYCINILKPNKFVFSFSIGTLSATVSLLSAKIIRKKERKTTT